jgi:hypothetical protein
VISRPYGGLHDWVQQIPRSFRITILDISQMTSKPRGGLNDWVRQTLRSFETTILESNMKHKVQTEFLDKFKYKTKECALQEAHTSLKSHHELTFGKGFYFSK